MEKRKTLEKKGLIQRYDECQKGKKKLLEKERLLTKKEREHIIEIFEKRNWKAFTIACVVFYVLVIGLSVFFFYLGGIKDAIINLALWTVFIVVYLGELYFVTEKHLRLVKENKAYVKEAIFLHSSKYHHGAFEIMKNGKREYFFCDVGIRDEIRKGEKVILVKIKKRVWVYKAREDEMQAD